MRRVFKQKQQQLPNWLILAIGLFVLAFWNWQLVLATLIGATTLILVYLAQDWDWNLILARLQKFLNSSNRSIIFAAIAGSTSIILSYVGLMVWSSVDNHWLAGMAITQSVAILGGLVLLFFKTINQWQQHSQQNINYLTAQLTSDDELERLIAVKQLAQALRQGHLPLPQEQAIAQYCQILLGREQAETVRSATLEVLEELKYLP
ncbi:hypothetical protein Syn7502_00564 [Synechococcus sp. PCC 7502]|uniref:hypothetical protein n=1 Tax=Synechococcus sp. PCC 7502 TaxID=1173263 RepID=UPI00029FBAA5|nr:hypothetical protein [Synechococcus sp. PCC 7502]AFY72718.1 hypothetical protein Syn7502_00564 [Synechococcus sp. PCC 7502]